MCAYCRFATHRAHICESCTDRCGNKVSISHRSHLLLIGQIKIVYNRCGVDVFNKG